MLGSAAGLAGTVSCWSQRQAQLLVSRAGSAAGLKGRLSRWSQGQAQLLVSRAGSAAGLKGRLSCWSQGQAQPLDSAGFTGSWEAGTSRFLVPNLFGINNLEDQAPSRHTNTPPSRDKTDSGLESAD